MPSLARAIAFAEKHLTAPDGTPFSFEGRDWLLNQIWRPYFGWKLWPVNPDKLCDECAAKAGTFVDEHELSSTHAKGECDGLKCEPQLIIAVRIKRQTGKTTGVKGLLLPQIFLDEHESIVFAAGSEDQAKRLYDEHYKIQVTNTPALVDHAKVRGTSIVTDKGSELQIVPTTISAVGGTCTSVVLDECRIVPANVAVAMLPMLFARGGWRCPLYHVRTHKGVEDPSAPKKCTVCGKRMVPWYGRALLTSSASEIKDTDADWFHEFIEYHRENPHPNIHVFDSEENLNPKVSSKVVNVFSEAFSVLDATRELAEIEAGNRSLRRGEPFVGDADIKRCIDRSLRNVEALAAPAVGFVDTSETDEKTSVVILANDTAAGSDILWEYLFQAWVHFWSPADLEGHVIDDMAVERHIDLVLGVFSGLREIYIDTRGRPWAIRMFKRLRQRSRKVKAWDKPRSDESDSGWENLRGRMLTRPRPTIRLQDIPEQTREFAGLRRRRSQNETMTKVIDRRRDLCHKDITESTAMCCYLVCRQQVRAVASGGMSRIVRVAAESAQRSAAVVGRAALKGPGGAAVAPMSFRVQGGNFGPEGF